MKQGIDKHETRYCQAWNNDETTRRQVSVIALCHVHQSAVKQLFNYCLTSFTAFVRHLSKHLTRYFKHFVEHPYMLLSHVRHGTVSRSSLHCLTAVKVSSNFCQLANPETLLHNNVMTGLWYHITSPNPVEKIDIMLYHMKNTEDFSQCIHACQGHLHSFYCCICLHRREIHL